MTTYQRLGLFFCISFQIASWTRMSRGTIFPVDEHTYCQFALAGSARVLFLLGGSIGNLSNGDMEFDITTPLGGVTSQIMEVNQTDTPQTVWQLNLTGENAYRRYRIPSLYPGVTWNQRNLTKFLEDSPGW